MTEIKLCSVDGCGKPVRSKGMCKPHYSRNKRWGNPEGKRGFYAAKGEPREWLVANAAHSGDDCLKWPFADRGNGYGAVTGENGELAGAHREMCKLAHGEPPSPSHDAAHSCGNGHEGCVNPNHLSWKTKSENMADKITHGTDQSGEKNGWAKITDKEVLQIRGLRGKMRQVDIASMFGISQAHVSKIQLNEVRNGPKFD